MSIDNVQSVGWIPRDDSFGARLSLVRQRMGWNAKEAAEHCELPPQSWRDWERGGHTRKQEEAARKIAQRVGCDYLWLFAGIDHGPTPSHDTRNITAKYSTGNRRSVMTLPQVSGPRPALPAVA